MRILAVGDIVGESGVRKLKEYYQNKKRRKHRLCNNKRRKFSRWNGNNERNFNDMLSAGQM